MRKCAFPFIALVLLSACQTRPVANTAETAAQLTQVDQQFSDYSKAHGMKAAFLSFIDSSGVLLRPGHSALEGSKARDYLKEGSDSSFVLTWTPLHAIAAGSGDIGYTYGEYSFQLHNQPVDSSEHGTYVTIWKKQADGHWKFVLDTGNSGLDKKK